MGEVNLRNCRGDRIDVEFKNSKFFEILKKWKELCFFYGGQARRLEYLIREDVKKIKLDIKEEVENK